MPIRDLKHTRFGRSRRRSTGITPPPVLSDGNTMMWVDFLENITKDGSDLTSVWGDKSGNGNDLLQATGTNQPLWTINGILFGGVDEFMKAVSFTLIQPEFIYIVFKQITWTSNERVFDGNTNNSGMISQHTSSPNINSYAGSFIGVNGNLALNTYGIVRCLFNGASSKLIVNQTTPVTGDSGAVGMAGFTLGSIAGGDGFFSNIEVKEVILRKVADSESDEVTIYNYLASKYGFDPITPVEASYILDGQGNQVLGGDGLPILDGNN